MGTRTHYDAGTPCWIDLMASDVDAAAAFYTALFGWEADDQYDDEGTRIYTNFLLDGKVVAGMGSQPAEMAGMPPMWNSYVATDDVAATLARVEDAGGQVMMPSMEVMTEGHMGIFADPSGAVLSLWQAGDHIGAQVVNQTNAWSWNELMTRDLDGVLPFYQAVFGWETDVMDMPMGPYHVVRGGEEGGLAGMMGMPPGMPDQVPNHWAVYFTVADAEATAARARDLGGMVANGPQPSGVGILATLHDPQGGSFNVMQPTPQDD